MNTFTNVIRHIVVSTISSMPHRGYSKNQGGSWKPLKRLLLLLFIVIPIIFNNGHGQTKKEKNVEILKTIWETMNAEYFDSTFGGLDWKKEYERFLPIVEVCQTNDSLYYYLNKMLFKLGVSHLAALPPDQVNTVGDPQLIFDGSVGLDVRVLHDKAIITKVFPHSSAEGMNLKPGFEIVEVNHKTIADIVQKRKSRRIPPFNDRNLLQMITSDIIRELYGTPGTRLDLIYRDARDQKHTAKLLLIERDLKKTLVAPNLPPMYASVQAKVIDERIGYIRFDVFHPAIRDTIVHLIKQYHQLPGMILDIRGNPGGEFGTRKMIAEQFVNKRTLFWKYQTRDRLDEVFLTPADNPYTGKLVILIDELSSSSSEEFAGGMQAIGRATTIGRQTTGKVLTMKAIALPEGALFIFPDRKTLTSRGQFLEGVGVVPDVKVELSREAVLKGIDPQLERAIQYLLAQ
jgi:carboxyl-terminal processing protease